MSDSETELEVAEILGERSSSRKGLEYLVRWKNFGPKQDSWEPLKNLTNAVQAIADFRLKAAPQQKKTRKSKSRSRSRSRSRSTSRSRVKKSSSPARGKKASPSRTSKRASPSQEKTRSTPVRQSTRTTTTVVTPTVEKTKTEVVNNSDGRFQKTSETVTKTVYSPAREQTTQVSRVTEYRSSTVGSQAPARGNWLSGCCAPLRKMKDCFRGCVSSDYPAIIVLSTIAVIVLSFLLERNVDFEKVWAAISAFFIGIWTWLTTLVSTK